MPLATQPKPTRTAVMLHELEGEAPLSEHAQRALAHMRELTCPHERSGVSSAKICGKLGGLGAQEQRNVVNELVTTGCIERIGDGYRLLTQ